MLSYLTLEVKYSRGVCCFFNLSTVSRCAFIAVVADEWVVYPTVAAISGKERGISGFLYGGGKSFLKSVAQSPRILATAWSLLRLPLSFLSCISSNILSAFLDSKYFSISLSNLVR